MTRQWRSSLPLVATLAALFAACGSPSNPSPSPTAVPAAPPPTTLPPTGTLLFSDDFNSGDLSRNWTTGGNPNSIVVIGGRVRSTENGNWIETRQTFSGGLRIELEVEKEETRNHGCWDFIVDIRAALTQGVVLFDTSGVDSIGVYSPFDQACLQGSPHPFTMPGRGPNQGTTTLTHANGTARFRFENSSGQVLETGVISAGVATQSPIRIWLAAYTDAPRFVDSVKVFVP
jgi:hypothetical protein